MKAMGIDMERQRSAVLFLMWKRSIRDSQKSKGACG